LYARSGDLSIAYQVVGEGPDDVLMIPGWFSHLALDWEEPTWVRWVERLASFARLVRFDKRGTGMSDRPPGIPTPDERMEDARAVMDAAGLTAAHVLGWSEGGPLAILLAVTHPDRVQSLILYGTQATFRRRDDYPFGERKARGKRRVVCGARNRVGNRRSRTRHASGRGSSVRAEARALHAVGGEPHGGGRARQVERVD
jgi:pimeloyl-ACP methyl ester carboxylesterase